MFTAERRTRFPLIPYGKK